MNYLGTQMVFSCYKKYHQMSSTFDPRLNLWQQDKSDANSNLGQHNDWKKNQIAISSTSGMYYRLFLIALSQYSVDVKIVFCFNMVGWSSNRIADRLNMQWRSSGQHHGVLLRCSRIRIFPHPVKFPHWQPYVRLSHLPENDSPSCLINKRNKTVKEKRLSVRPSAITRSNR